MKKLLLGIGLGFIFILCLGLTFANRDIATDDVIIITEADETTRWKMKWSDVESFIENNIDTITESLAFSDNVTIAGDLEVTGDISGVNADAKLVRSADSTYAMSGTDWQVIDDWNWSCCVAYNMTVDSTNYNIECNTGYAGKYLITGFVSLSVDKNSQNIYIGLGKNGNDPATFTQANAESKTAGEISNISFTNMPTLSAGDSLSFYIKNADSNENITIGRSNFVFHLLHQE